MVNVNVYAKLVMSPEQEVKGDGDVACHLLHFVACISTVAEFGDVAY